MGKTAVNYIHNAKISPRAQRFQSRKRLLQVRARIAGNISNYGRRSDQGNSASTAIIKEVPNQDAHSRTEIVENTLPSASTETPCVVVSLAPCSSISVKSVLTMPECSITDTLSDCQSNDQHTCVLVTDPEPERESHFTRRETSLIYSAASKVSEGFNYQLAQLASRHSLSNICVEDILKLCQQLMYSTEEVPLPKNFKGWEDSFEAHTLVEIIFYWICDVCTKVNFRPLKDQPFSMQCCNKQITQTDEHFVVFNIADILELKLPSIQTKFKRSFVSPRLEELICQHHITEEDIMITLNIDGVPRCTSSSAALYPVLVYFDDLCHREKKENIMVFGIWIGKEGGKLNVKSFLSPIIQQLRDLQENGLQWKNKNGEIIKSRVFVSSVLCDSIARPQVQSMKQFNAEYGCGYCFHRESGHYFTPTACASALRTNEDHRHLSSRTTDSFGIKDECVFETLNYFDLIMDFPPCILHSLHLGVAKQFLAIWLSQRKKFNHAFSQRKTLEIDQFLKNIKPPYRVSRCPRSLKFFKFYKGHELSMWLFYYSPIVLETILPPEYYKHWLELLKGTSKLLGKTICPQDINEAEEHLKSFVKGVFTLYGRENCTYNVHLLSHMSWLAAKKGPLQNYSMSVFENHNMVLKRYITSSQFLSYQICNRYCRDLIVQIESANSVTSETNLTDRFEASSPLDNDQISTSMFAAVRNYFKEIQTFSFFGFLRTHKKRYYSLLYSKVKKRNSCCCLIGDSQVLEIHFFVQYKSSYFAVGELYETHRFNSLGYIRKASQKTESIKSVGQLGQVLIKVCLDAQIYFGQFLNDVENYAE